MTRTEIVETVARMERREVDRRMAERMEGGRRRVADRMAAPDFATQVLDIIQKMEAVDWEYVPPQPVPELVIPGREGGRWVGSFSDSWGEGR